MYDSELDLKYELHISLVETDIKSLNIKKGLNMDLFFLWLWLHISSENEQFNSHFQLFLIWGVIKLIFILRSDSVLLFW